MKTVGIREMKAKLRAYVRDVERGEVVLVTDRGRVVAEFRPPGSTLAAATPADSRRQQMIADGRLRPARTGERVRLASFPPRRLRTGVTVQQLIDAERGE